MNDDEWLTAEEVTRSFWYNMYPGIRLRWSPSLVAKLAMVDGGKKWGEEPRWLRIMPQITAWTVIRD
jgi:hypothetical protein